MTRKLPPLEELRHEAERLGIRWQPYGVCRRKLADRIEEELEQAKVTIASWESVPDRGIEEYRTRAQRKRRSVEREEAIGEWIRIVHGVEPEGDAPEVANKIVEDLERIKAWTDFEDYRGKLDHPHTTESKPQGVSGKLSAAIAYLRNIGNPGGHPSQVADKIARMGEQIETLRGKLAKKDQKIEALRESEAAKDRQIEALGQVVRGGERQLAELKAQIAGQEGQLKELVAEMFHLEHARDVARKHAQERGRAMYSGPRTQLDRLGEIERRLAQIEDTRPGHEPRPLGPAIHEWLNRETKKK